MSNQCFPQNPHDPRPNSCVSVSKIKLLIHAILLDLKSSSLIFFTKSILFLFQFRKRLLQIAHQWKGPQVHVSI